MPYDCINTLRFVLAHTLRTHYKRDPADFKDLFSRDSLTQWLETGYSGDEILRQTFAVEGARDGLSHRP